MRVSSFSIPVIAAVFLAGCGPQDRSVEFYTQAENAAEFANAIEICKKSGLSKKDKCVAVWQAKAKMDAAEDKVLRERAISELGGTTVVPQSPRPAPVSGGISPRKPTNVEAAITNRGGSTSKN